MIRNSTIMSNNLDRNQMNAHLLDELESYISSILLFPVAKIMTGQLCMEHVIRSDPKARSSSILQKWTL